jgi:ribonuclease VapC
MSAGNYLECAMIAESRFGGRAVLDNWLRERAIEIVSVDLPMAQGAAEAFRRFGKRTHQAALNYGDCFAYALAKSLDAPLLFKGCDFALTDIQSALP